MKTLTVVLIATISAILGSVITFISIAYFFGGDINKLLVKDPYLLGHKVGTLNYIDRFSVERLLEKNIIFSSDDLLGQIGSFYSTIIIILVTLITIVSFFTYFFVKGTAEEKAETQAKAVAQRVIDDKITPKINQLDSSLGNISDLSIENKIDIQLQHKLFDSLSFWEKVEESIYKKSEEALEDYNISSIYEALDRHQSKIESISKSIQDLSTPESDDEENADDDGNIIDIG